MMKRSVPGIGYARNKERCEGPDGGGPNETIAPDLVPNTQIG